MLVLKETKNNNLFNLALSFDGCYNFYVVKLTGGKTFVTTNTSATFGLTLFEGSNYKVFKM